MLSIRVAENKAIDSRGEKIESIQVPENKDIDSRGEKIGSIQVPENKDIDSRAEKIESIYRIYFMNIAIPPVAVGGE